MKIIYKSEQDAKEFDMDRYLKSLNRYGEVKRGQVEEGLKDFPYDPLHVSCLVELGVRLLPEKEAREYFENHKREDVDFERLRRITGYLVGTLGRWNDAKKAEEKARVKHNLPGQYDQEEKEAIEYLKYENSVMSQI